MPSSLLLSASDMLHCRWCYPPCSWTRSVPEGNDAYLLYCQCGAPQHALYGEMRSNADHMGVEIPQFGISAHCSELHMGCYKRRLPWLLSRGSRQPRCLSYYRRSSMTSSSGNDSSIRPQGPVESLLRSKYLTQDGLDCCRHPRRFVP